MFTGVTALAFNGDDDHMMESLATEGIVRIK